MQVKYAWQRPTRVGEHSSGGGALSQTPYNHGINNSGGAGAAGASTSSSLPSASVLNPNLSPQHGLHPSSASAAAASAASAAGFANDLFQFSTHEGLGVGGVGGLAVWLDNELLEGASHPCETFRSPCLACSEEYAVATVELWHL